MSLRIRIGAFAAALAAAFLFRLAPAGAQNNSPLATGDILITEFFDGLFRVNPTTGARTPLGELPFNAIDPIALDANRQLLAVDDQDRLMRLNLTTLSAAPVTAALFPFTVDIEVEASGSILVATNDDLFRVNPVTGMTTTLVNHEMVNDGFFSPRGLAVGPTGRIFVTEFFEELWEINPTSGAATKRSLSRAVNLPSVIESRFDGDLITREFNTGNLLRINPNTGAVVTFATGLPTFTKEIAIEADNDVLATSTDGVFRYAATNGAETPLIPVGPGDFFSPLGIVVTPPSILAGDFTENGSVAAADLVNWKGGFGVLNSATHGQGDADKDGDVDGADLLVWQTQLAGGSGSAASAGPVPEPASALIALIAAAPMIATRRRR